MIEGSLLPQLNVRRSYAAPRDLIFRAFTEASLLERWFCPSPDISVKVTQLDLRVGGKYRFVFHFPGDRIAVVVGEYRTVARPRQLAFTWTWEPPDPHAGIDTLVTIDLYEKGGGTELALTHAHFPTEEIMRRHESGWGATLDRLSQLVANLSEEARTSSRDSV
ncbi:MAG: SRPBCC family protein [Gemmatimonadales bacterium]